MRIVCPNCGAQYEVEDAAIPPEGRDVQCSSCGHGWFQARPELAAPRAGQETVREPAGPEPAAQDDATRSEPAAPAPERQEPEPEPEPEPEREGDTWPEEEVDAEGDDPRSGRPEDDDDDIAVAAEERAARTARGLDPEIAAILKAEAEREARLRAGEAEAVRAAGMPPAEEARPVPQRPERSPEERAAADARRERMREAIMRERRLGMEERTPTPRGRPDPEPAEAPRRPGREAVAAQESEAAIAPAPRRPERGDAESDGQTPARPGRRDAETTGARRDLLPDVEELNSTLRAANEDRPRSSKPASPAVEAPTPAGRGFRRTVSLLAVVIAVLVLVYYRPDMVTTFLPQAEAPLAVYRDLVGQAHAVLFSLGQALVDAVSGLLSRFL